VILLVRCSDTHANNTSASLGIAYKLLDGYLDLLVNVLTSNHIVLLQARGL